MYTHRRMAITAEDVWLERVIPITDGFAVEEGTDTLWSVPRNGMKGFGVRILLFCFLKFAIYSALTFFQQLVILGEICASHGICGRAL